MSLADELMKLERLRASGALSEAEFQTAKEIALRTATAAQPTAGSDAAAATEAEQPTAPASGLATFIVFAFFVLLICFVAFVASL